MGAEKILLGYGVVKIGNVAVGLTRGGGQFTVEREYRKIEADGDKGTVKDRVTKDKSVPKLKVSMLEIIGDNLTDVYPALTATTSESKTTVTGAKDIASSDYNETVTWTGKTKAGKEVIITLQNAINLDNIDWALQDKGEVVAQATFEGCYTDSDRETEPWSVEYVE